MRWDLPAPITEALDKLAEKGYSAYAVGGCVRDFLRGTAPHDIDLCTDALPEEIEACFPRERTVMLGARFGTVGVRLHGELVEITTFRKDGEYSDGRRPDTVTFTDTLAEDLKRRDFTINAMAYHPRMGIVDLFGGQSDIEAGRIACVGDASARFEEDALRILRALRFAATLGYEIEENTLQAMRAQCMRLQQVSAERIAQECTRMLLGKDAGRVLAAHRDILSTVIPEICINAADYEARVSAVPCVPLDEAVRWAAWLPAQGPNPLARLKCAKALIQSVQALRTAKGQPVPADIQAVRRALGQWGAEAFAQWLSLHAAMGHAAGDAALLQAADTARSQAEQVLAESLCYRTDQLALTGADLLGLGYPPGPAVGRMLRVLLSAVIDGMVPNEREALLRFAAQRKGEC